jgi:hypothetical protein
VGEESPDRSIGSGAVSTVAAPSERTRRSRGRHAAWLAASITALLIGGLAALSGNDLLFSTLTPALFGVWLMTLTAAITWSCRPAIVTVAVVLPSLMIAAMLIDGPATVRAAASQNQLADAYADVRAGRDVDDVGFYRVISSSVSDSGCVVFVTHELFMADQSGVAYCPDGLTPAFGTFEPLFGPLYSYDYVD